jgi:hypothetical protein
VRTATYIDDVLRLFGSHAMKMVSSMVMLITVGGCVSNPCIAMFSSSEPGGQVFDVTFPLDVVERSGDNALAAKERHGEYEKRLNTWLAEAAPEAACIMHEGSIRFFESGPRAAATVTCEGRLALFMDATSFTLDHRPIYRACIPKPGHDMPEVYRRNMVNRQVRGPEAK